MVYRDLQKWVNIDLQMIYKDLQGFTRIYKNFNRYTMIYIGLQPIIGLYKNF